MSFFNFVSMQGRIRVSLGRPQLRIGSGIYRWKHTRLCSTQSHTHPPLARMLSENLRWAKGFDQAEPGFFEQSAKGQSPHTFWIGCADSRVPESVITASRPGEIFVHRNVANRFSLDDDSAVSALTFAVDFVGVEHVAVVGHTGCGAAMSCLDAAQRPQSDPSVTIESLSASAPLNRWLTPITKLAASLELSTTPYAEAVRILVEANVKKQVESLSKAQVILDAWANKSAKGKDVWIHGWIYDVGTGKLKDLGISRGPPLSR